MDQIEQTIRDIHEDWVLRDAMRLIGRIPNVFRRLSAIQEFSQRTGLDPNELSRLMEEELDITGGGR